MRNCKRIDKPTCQEYFSPHAYGKAENAGVEIACTCGWKPENGNWWEFAINAYRSYLRFHKGIPYGDTFVLAIEKYSATTRGFHESLPKAP